MFTRFFSKLFSIFQTFLCFMRLEITHHFALHCKKKEALKLLRIEVKPTCILKTYVFFRIYLLMLKHTKEHVDHQIAFSDRIFLFLM